MTTYVLSRALRDACAEKFWSRSIFSAEALEASAFIDAAVRTGKQLLPLSAHEPGFDQAKAYEISAASCYRQVGLRVIPVGRKIGFTNQSIWSQYNVNEPNWGYLWHKSTYWEQPQIMISDRQRDLQPRVEPEIIFRLKSVPRSSMSEVEALSCIEWMAHGYEIVQSVWKDWKFSGADTTASNALHSKLYIGTPREISTLDPESLADELKTFQITMQRDQFQGVTGSGSSVLGSPIKALLYLCRMLENQSLHPGLCPGEIITTGTLTKAMPISYNDKWKTTLKGIDLPDMKMFVRKVVPPTKEEKAERTDTRAKSQRPSYLRTRRRATMAKENGSESGEQNVPSRYPNIRFVAQ